MAAAREARLLPSLEIRRMLRPWYSRSVHISFTLIIFRRRRISLEFASVRAYLPRHGQPLHGGMIQHWMPAQLPLR